MPGVRDAMRFEQVERFLASGMGVSEWCALNKVANSTLYAWMNRYRKSEPSADLSNQQKRKETTDWIRFSREELAGSVALALKQPALTGCGLMAQDAQVLHRKDTPAQPYITVAFADASVTIPSGCKDSDIEAVIKAVRYL